LRGNFFSKCNFEIRKVNLLFYKKDINGNKKSGCQRFVGEKKSRSIAAKNMELTLSEPLCRFEEGAVR
jgi:hypothetical protein